jgi:hypothetical protein
MRDFTLNVYRNLLLSLKGKRYSFLPFADFIQSNQIEQSHKQKTKQSICILRHDVDRKPLNSFTTAKIENELGIKGTYYFRIVSESFNERIIGEIANLGHEIGYHYEDIDLVLRGNKTKLRGQNNQIDKESLVDLAYESFCRNLKLLKQYFDIKTICMHGSPLSRYDNKIIWEKYNYKDLDLIGEPYFDIDWNEFAYFTDTGRKWNGADSSVRDKVESKFKFKFKSTEDIVDNINMLPKSMMFTIHPQRWNNNLMFWLNEYITQNIKNVIKKNYYLRL